MVDIHQLMKLCGLNVSNYSYLCRPIVWPLDHVHFLSQSTGPNMLPCGTLWCNWFNLHRHHTCFCDTSAETYGDVWFYMDDHVWVRSVRWLCYTEVLTNTTHMGYVLWVQSLINFVSLLLLWCIQLWCIQYPVILSTYREIIQVSVITQQWHTSISGPTWRIKYGSGQNGGFAALKYSQKTIHRASYRMCFVSSQSHQELSTRLQ